MSKSIRELQDTLPWGAHGYSTAFQANTVEHRDYAHAYLHVQKALGKLAEGLDAADHNENVVFAFKAQPPAGKYIADLVICALRLANTCPEGRIDLQDAVDARLREKFGG